VLKILDSTYAFVTSYTKILGYDKVRDVIAENEGDGVRIKSALEKLIEDM
jgi:hypothetical protein